MMEVGLGMASPRSVASEPNPSARPKSTSLAEIATLDCSGVASISDDGALEEVPLESEEGGPADTVRIDRLAAIFFRFFNPGDRPIGPGESSIVGIEGVPADTARRIDREIGVVVSASGRERLTVDTLAAVPYILKLRGRELLPLLPKTALALRIRLGGFDDSSNSSTDDERVWRETSEDTG